MAIFNSYDFGEKSARAKGADVDDQRRILPRFRFGMWW